MDFNLGGFFDGIKTALTELFQKIGNMFGGAQISAGVSVGGGLSGGYVTGGYGGGYGGPALRPLEVGAGIRTSVAMGTHFSLAAAGGGYGGPHVAVGYGQTRVSHDRRVTSWGIGVGLG